jgi:hypothetical protein
VLNDIKALGDNLYQPPSEFQTQRRKTAPGAIETYATIIDPLTGVEVRISRDELWKLMFAAAGCFCSEQAMSGGKRDNRIFVECMHMVTVGRFHEDDIQKFVNQSKFPVEEFIRGIR